MGSGGSKIGKQIPGEHPQEGSVPSTPILTPKVKENNDLDPRSPSTHISRTPLQLLSAAAVKLEELKQNDLYSFINETPIKSQQILLGIDPRSPTTEFKRTPIVINAVDSELPKKIRNKNLDKVRRSAIITTPKSTPEKLLTEKLPPNIIPPKLLESSPIKPKPEANKRKSLVGLLETNIDFTETDLDVVILEKCKIKEKPLDEVTPSLRNRLGVSIENDPRSPSNDFLRTPIQITKKIHEIELNDEESDAVIEMEAKHKNEDNLVKVIVEAQDNNEKEKTGITRETCKTVHVENIIENEMEQISPAETNDNVSKNMASINEDVVEIEKQTMVTLEGDIIINNTTPTESEAQEIPQQTKSAPATPPVMEVKQSSKPVVTPILKEAKSAPVTPPLVNITADVKELDKKLTNLIYQDKDIVICPRIVKLKEHSNRSPLKNRNSEPEKKSAHKLKVSDKPRKSDYAVSKIPIFKEKGKNFEVQCENTPPRNMEKRKMKVRKSHWDNADTTLFI